MRLGKTSCVRGRAAPANKKWSHALVLVILLFSYLGEKKGLCSDFALFQGRPEPLTQNLGSTSAPCEALTILPLYDEDQGI